MNLTHINSVASVKTIYFHQASLTYSPAQANLLTYTITSVRTFAFALPVQVLRVSGMLAKVAEAAAVFIVMT